NAVPALALANGDGDALRPVGRCRDNLVIGAPVEERADLLRHIERLPLRASTANAFDHLENVGHGDIIDRPALPNRLDLLALVRLVQRRQGLPVEISLVLIDLANAVAAAGLAIARQHSFKGAILPARLPALAGLLLVLDLLF